MTTALPATINEPALPARAEPVAASERIRSLDVLRGFALLGILLVNMGFFSHTWVTAVTGTMRGETALDHAAEAAIIWLATSKFYVLFSFLFGLGFSIQMIRWQARGEGGAGRMIRRLLVLMGFGLLHALLIWNGDILFLYGFYGLVLILFRNARPRTLFIWAAGLILVPFLFGLGLAGLSVLGASVQGTGPAGRPDMPGSPAWFLALEQDVIDTYARGTWGEIFTWRAIEWLVFLGIQGIASGLTILAMFCVGLAVGKLVCTFIFYSYGLGLFGSVGAAAGLGLSLVI